MINSNTAPHIDALVDYSGPGALAVLPLADYVMSQYPDAVTLTEATAAVQSVLDVSPPTVARAWWWVLALRGYIEPVEPITPDSPMTTNGPDVAHLWVGAL